MVQSNAQLCLELQKHRKFFSCLTTIANFLKQYILWINTSLTWRWAVLYIVAGFAFGHRGNMAGYLEPGLSNEAMARIILHSYPRCLITVQGEIGTALRRLGVSPHHEVFEHALKLGAYLDTPEVARQEAEQIKKWFAEFGQLPVFTLAQDDHMPRCIETLRTELEKVLGDGDFMIKPGCMNIPCDPLSAQIWTRNRTLFRSREKLVPYIQAALKVIGH